VEIVVAPNIKFVRSIVLMRSTTNLGHGLGGVSLGMNLSRSSRIPLTTTIIVGTL
jgi:hypothetical protein